MVRISSVTWLERDIPEAEGGDTAHAMRISSAAVEFKILGDGLSIVNFPSLQALSLIKNT
jgi:hypothetical protein